MTVIFRDISGVYYRANRSRATNNRNNLLVEEYTHSESVTVTDISQSRAQRTTTNQRVQLKNYLLTLNLSLIQEYR